MGAFLTDVKAHIRSYITKKTKIGHEHSRKLTLLFFFHLTNTDRNLNNGPKISNSIPKRPSRKILCYASQKSSILISHFKRHVNVNMIFFFIEWQRSLYIRSKCYNKLL